MEKKGLFRSENRQISDKLVQENRSDWLWFPEWKDSGGIIVQIILPPPPCPRRHSLACLCSDKALMESNMRTVLTPVSLIYQDYWHLQKQVVCLDEMFPRQKEKKKKSGLIIPALGTSRHWFVSAGQKRWELRLQETLGVLGMSHPQLPLPPQALVFPHTGNVNKPTLYTSRTLLTPWPSSLCSPPQASFSFPSPTTRSAPICFLLGVHFQSAGWWNLEFRPPRVMRVLGLLKVPSRGPCHLPLLPRPMPHSPLCNNMLEPTSVFNSMFIWTALGKWKLSLKAGVLKQQHEYKQLYLTNKKYIHVCMHIWRKRERDFLISRAGAISLKICLSWFLDEAIYNHGFLMPSFLVLMAISCPISNLGMLPEFHNLNQWSACSADSSLHLQCIVWSNNRAFSFFFHSKK